MTPQDFKAHPVGNSGSKVNPNAVLTDNELQEVNHVMFDDAITNHQY